MWLVLTEDGVQTSASCRFSLGESSLVIGSAAECDVIVTGRTVSRRHVVLKMAGDILSFEYGGSGAGLDVNGTLIPSGQLKAGDVIAIGRAKFIVEEKLGEVAAKAQPKSEDNLVDWQPLEAFLDHLRTSTEPKVLLERLLLGLVEVFSAQRGYVLLKEGKGQKLVPVAAHRLGDTDSFVAISKTVYERALSEGNIVYVPDTLRDEWYLSASDRSLADMSRSIICGPLAANGETFGVIYVDGPTELVSNRTSLFETVTGLAAELLGAGKVRESLLATEGRLQALSALSMGENELVLGDGAEAKELQENLRLAGEQDVAVLITGETGTGKEMVARALHRQSKRSSGPFVPVNCAALPRDIIEAELFGVEKGAYTGATERRLGRFELAAGGTLFLDEIGELPLEVQVKLLRVLQERVVQRLGGAFEVPLDFRLVCATNRALEQEVRDGSFRADLYYRINVFRLHLKPLRERLTDIEPLAKHFLALFADRFGRSYKGFHGDAMSLLKSHRWDGNIRELRNAIERAALIERTPEIRPESLPIMEGQTAPAGQTHAGGGLNELPRAYRDAKTEFEKAFFIRALEVNKHNIAKVARETGLTRKTIYTKLGQLGVTLRE